MRYKTPASRLLQLAGIKDARVAEFVGCNPATAWRWRQGVKQPSDPSQLRALAQLLGCHPRDLRPDLAAIFEVAA